MHLMALHIDLAAQLWGMADHEVTHGKKEAARGPQ